jgi:hypothetical protein
MATAPWQAVMASPGRPPPVGRRRDSSAPTPCGAGRGFPVDGGGVLVRGDGLAEPARLLQVVAEVVSAMASPCRSPVSPLDSDRVAVPGSPFCWLPGGRCPVAPAPGAVRHADTNTSRIPPDSRAANPPAVVGRPAPVRLPSSAPASAARPPLPPVVQPVARQVHHRHPAQPGQPVPELLRVSRIHDQQVDPALPDGGQDRRLLGLKVQLML